MKLRRIALCLAVCMAAVVAVPASAMTTAQEFRDLWNGCAQGIDRMLDNGWVVEHIEFDWMRLGEVYVSTETLSAGHTFKIVGVGGHGIADLDIRVYDENGNLVAADTLNDDVPEVDITPAWTGPFRVEVAVEAAEAGWDPADSWYFAYMVLSK